MPHSIPLLEDLLILLLCSVPVAFLFNRLRLPAIIGFIITGVLIGPSGLGLIGDTAAIEVLAEIGVVLLLFTIGLEFSLRHILEMRRLVFGGGGLQVVITTLLVAVVAWALGRAVSQSIFFGFLFALSSTAIVLRSYIDRLEIDTPHGRAAVGILLFQDLCIVPMMLLVPILSGKEGASAVNIALTLGAALGAVAVIILAARIVIPRALYYIVRLRSSEVFIIFIVLVSLGTSWLTSQMGLSLALGAFIAGLVLSESEYSHQIVADILPFREVFNSVFFVSIGMLLSVKFLASNALAVLALVIALTVGKTIVALLVTRLLGHSLRVSTMTALGIAQVGEFSFILAKAGIGQGLLAESDYQIFLAASVLSMMAAPFLINAAPRIGYWVQSKLSPDSLFEPSLIGLASEDRSRRGHVVIVGYGLNGRNLSKVLRRVGIPYLVLELNAETVRQALTQGESISYGDSTRREVLHRADLESARILVVAISDPIATRRTAALAREMNPDIHIIVRTRYVSELADLYDLGADQIIPEEFETSVEIFSRVLREYGVARQAIQREVESIRKEGYQLLRLPVETRIEMTDIAGILESASTETLSIEPDFSAVGRTLGEMEVRKATGATVIAAVRSGTTFINPGPEFELAAQDIIVLLGSPEAIERAVEKISSTKIASSRG